MSHYPSQTMFSPTYAKKEAALKETTQTDAVDELLPPQRALRSYETSQQEVLQLLHAALKNQPQSVHSVKKNYSGLECFGCSWQSIHIVNLKLMYFIVLII